MIGNEPTALIVICSRLASRRIPEKAFKVIAGHTVMEHILERIAHSELPIVVAVPHSEVAEYKARLGVRRDCYVIGGNAESPLHRMSEIAIAWKEQSGKLPDYIIRITNDDILIDRESMLGMLEMARRDNLTYCVASGIVEGAGVEVIRTDVLIAAAQRTHEDVEHISYFVKSGAGLDPHIGVFKVRESIKRPEYRLTMDYPNDAILLETILREVGWNASADAVCEHLDRRRWLLRLNKMPDVTLYTCAYNAEKWIRETIRSVIGIPNTEYIIVDDSSTDKTLTAIVEAANGFIDENFRIIVNDKNIGLASSCNKVLEMARGRYIMRVDADDLLMPHALETMLRAIVTQDAAILYSAYHEIDEKGRDLRRDIAPNVNHHAGCALMDRKLLNELKFTEGLRNWDGLDLYYRMKKIGKIAYSPEAAWFYRRRKGSVSNSNHEQRSAERAELDRKHID